MGLSVLKVRTSFQMNDVILIIASIILKIVMLCVQGMLAFGFISFYLKISRNEEVTYKDLFKKTHLFLPYILINIVVYIFVFLWSLLFIIPGIIAAISYSFVYFIKLDHEDYTTMEVIAESKKLMMGHKLQYFLLNFSFIGWIILTPFTLGLLYFWLIPYMMVTNINFYNYLKERN